MADHGAGFARTNALGTVRDVGATNFAVHGLKPGTDYVAALVATNAAGAVREVPVGSFRTSGEFHGDADSGIDKAPVWSVEAWDNSPDPLSDNMLRSSRGTSASFASRRPGTGWESHWNGALGGTWKFGDGFSADGCIAPGTNQAVIFVLDRPQAIREFRFWAYWDSGWARVNVHGIETRSGPNEDWVEIPGSSIPSIRSTGSGQLGVFKATGDDWLARDASEIRINFRHNGSQPGTIWREIEAFGVPEDEAPGLHDGAGKGRALVAGTAVRTPTLFSAVVSAPAGEPAFTNVVAAWGPVYGGEDTNAWKNVQPLGSMGTGAASLPLSLSDVELGDAAYVRFCGFGEDGSVSWSDSVYVPEIPVRDDLPPVVEFGGLAGSAGASADLSAALLYAGSASPDGTADVVLRLTLDPDGFEEGSGAVIDEFPFATGAAVGTIGPVRIQPLRAARRYYGRFVASNRGGQVSTGEVFSFETSSGTGESMSDWGLRQQKFTQMGGSVEDLRAAVWDESQAEVVEGAIMGYKSGNGDVYSAKAEKTFNWNDRGGWIYKGFVFLEGEVPYTIGGSIDDAIEIKIDGTSVVAVEGNGSAWGSFTPPSTGWFELEIRMGDGGGGYGRDFGIAWNTTGKNAFNDEDSNRFIDPGDGSFLRPGADRSLEITAFAVSGNTLSVAARATSGRPNGDLYLVCGPSDLGPDAALADWGTAGGRTVQVLTGVDGRERTTTATLSAFDANATPVLRLALVAEGTGAIVYSRPVVVDGILPLIGPASATTDGDRMTVSGTVLSAGTGGNFALKVLWGYAEDLSDAEEAAVSVSGAGPFSATVPVRPGTNGWWKLVATTSGGGYDATLPEPFKTKAGSVLQPAATATVAHHTATVTATLDVLGAGVTTATLWAGADPSNLVEVAGSALVLSKTGKFTLSATFPGLPHEVYWKVVAVNTTAPAGNAEWRSETDVFSLRTFDQGTYTWKPDVAAGDWDDPLNWDVSPADLADAVGYPDSEQAKVRFVAGTEATIAVDREFVFADMSFKYAGLRLTFVGTNAANCTLSGDIPNVASDQNDGTVVSGTRIVLSGITLYDSNGAFNWSTKASADCTLRLENGAVLSMDGWMHVFGTNMWVEAFGGSRLVWRNPTSDGAGFDICGFDGGIRLDDSTMNLPYLVPQRHVKVVGAPQHIVLSGESQLRLNNYFRTWNNSEDYMTNDVLFAFSVPAGGWDSAPLYAEYTGSANNKKLGWRDVEPVGKLVFAVDPKSPAFKKGKSFRTQLVSWRAGIDEKSVAYRDSTTRTGFVWARLFFTYGWPSKRTEPLEQGEVPTGVAADIVGQGATFLIFR
ncbi:MAG: hypothetical protein IJL06_03365 [Kiritimatiellae bacterium]|nr:hypothetical protein [Kiritimatiellia bacterium]